MAKQKNSKKNDKTFTKPRKKVFYYIGEHTKRQKEIKGNVEAINKQNAEIIIKKRNIRPKKIYFNPLKTYGKQYMTKSEFIKFLTFFKTNMENSVQISQILDKYAETNRDVQHLIISAKDIYNKRTQTKYIFEYLYPDVSFMSMIEVAEKNGAIETTLETIIDLLEEQITSEKELKGKIMMPKMTLFIGIMAFINVSYNLIPTFDKVIKQMKFELQGITANYYFFFADLLHSEQYEGKLVWLVNILVTIAYFKIPQTKIFKMLMYSIIPALKTRDDEMRDVLNYKLLSAMDNSGIRIDEALKFIGEAGDPRLVYVSKQKKKGVALSDSLENFNRNFSKKNKKRLKFIENNNLHGFGEFSEDEIDQIAEGENSSRLKTGFDRIISNKKQIIKTVNNGINAVVPTLFTLLTALLIGSIFILLIFPVTQATMSKF